MEAAFSRYFSEMQLPLDVVFNFVLSAVTLSSSIKFIPQFPVLDRVRYGAFTFFPLSSRS